MKVLLVNSLYAPDEFGGAEKSVRLLAASLRRKGIGVAVAATSTSDRQDVVEGNPVYYSRTPNAYWLGSGRAQPLLKKVRWHLRDAFNARVDPFLRSVIQRENPDIVHTHNLSGWSTYAWTVARSERKRVVHTIRDHYLLCTKSTMFRGGENCSRQCSVCAWHGRRKAKGFLRLDAVTGVSDYILHRHRACASLPEAGAYVRIPNGVEADASFAAPPRAGRPFTFGFVGSLATHKGVELLLSVFSKSAIPQARLSLFGNSSSPREEERLRRAYASERIVFRGFRAPSEAFSEIDALVVPSLCEEAFGRVVPEAYAHGIPVIVARRGGLPELVREGETGTLFDPDDENELASKLRAWATGPALLESMSRTCRSEAHQFASDHVADRFVALYHEVTR